MKYGQGPYPELRLFNSLCAWEVPQVKRRQWLMLNIKEPDQWMIECNKMFVFVLWHVKVYRVFMLYFEYAKNELMLFDSNTSSIIMFIFILDLSLYNPV